MKLLRPSLEHIEEIRSYRQEFLDCGDSMDGTGALRNLERPEEWLAHTKLCENAETVPENLVTATQFVLMREEDMRIVGMIQLRHYFNDYLEKYGGHIGYSVRPSERGKGYAGYMLSAILPFCREAGLDRVLITCDADNEASRRTILRAGGVYESTVLNSYENEMIERYWIKL